MYTFVKYAKLWERLHVAASDASLTVQAERADATSPQ